MWRATLARTHTYTHYTHTTQTHTTHIHTHYTHKPIKGACPDTANHPEAGRRIRFQDCVSCDLWRDGLSSAGLFVRDIGVEGRGGLFRRTTCTTKPVRDGGLAVSNALITRTNSLNDDLESFQSFFFFSAHSSESQFCQAGKCEPAA